MQTAIRKFYGAIIEQNLNMAPIEQFFFARDALPTIFDNQYTLCNEIEKTDYVMEIENKQDLTSW